MANLAPKTLHSGGLATERRNECGPTACPEPAEGAQAAGSFAYDEKKSRLGQLLCVPSQGQELTPDSVN